MGLRAQFSVIHDIGHKAYTPHYHWEIDYSEGCDIFIQTFLDVADEEVPVDTGYLQSRTTADSTGDEITCENDCDYAQYVEFGTVKMGAQPFFQPALDAAYDAAEPVWQEAEEEAIQEDEEQYQAEMQQAMAQGGGGGGGGIPTSLGQLGGLILAALFVGLFDLALRIALGLEGGNERSPIPHAYGYNDSAADGKIQIEIID